MQKHCTTCYIIIIIFVGKQASLHIPIVYVSEMSRCELLTQLCTVTPHKSLLLLEGMRKLRRDKNEKGNIIVSGNEL